MSEHSTESLAERGARTSVELSSAMEVWPVALAAVKHEGGFRFANEAAREQLMELQQTNVNLHGELIVKDKSLLSFALANRSSEVTLQQTDSSKIGITITLFHGDYGRDTVLLFSGRLSTKKKGTAISLNFGLTKAEEEIVILLIEGYSVAAIAKARNTSSHTVRSQLKAIFRKTETHRQAELISLCVDQRPA